MGFAEEERKRRGQEKEKRRVEKREGTRGCQRTSSTRGSAL